MKVFFKHNDSLKRRIWLGIGEALLAAYIFGMLYFVPTVSFGKFRSNEHSVILGLVQVIQESIVVGFFALAVSLHFVIPAGGLLGYLLPKFARKYNPVQAFLMGGIGGVVFACGGAVCILIAFGTHSITTLRFWLDCFHLGEQMAVCCALWIGFRLALPSKPIKAENSGGDQQTKA